MKQKMVAVVISGVMAIGSTSIPILAEIGTQENRIEQDKILLEENELSLEK